MTLIVRVVLIALGVGLACYGAVLLLDLGTDNLFATGRWLIGGVILHDGLLGPATIILAALVLRLTRGRVPAPVILAALVLGSVTLVAVPVLGRYGARADNPTLLPRDYTVGWLVFAGLTFLLAALAVLRGRGSTKGGEDGTRAGR